MVSFQISEQAKMTYSRLALECPYSDGSRAPCICRNKSAWKAWFAEEKEAGGWGREEAAVLPFHKSLPQHPVGENRPGVEQK